MAESAIKQDAFLLAILVVLIVVAIIVATDPAILGIDNSKTDTAGNAMALPQPYCTDSDGGANYSLAGYTHGNGQNGTYYNHSDYCRSYNSTALVEYDCEGSIEDHYDYKCPVACNNGACVNKICGNGIIESGEQCDGTNLNGASCISLGYAANWGSLKCYNANSSNACKFDTSSCYPKFCNETDGGDNPYVKGTLTTNGIGSPTYTFIDGCTNNNTILTEYYCTNKTYNIKSYKCTCSNGACITMSATGSLYVTSNPSSASLYLDNQYQGLTPINLTGLSPRNYTVKLVRAGYYDYTTTKYVEARYNALSVTLTAKCGNGIIDSGESCDGTNLNNKTCQSFNFTGGTLNCYAANTTNHCTFDTGGCLTHRICTSDTSCVWVTGPGTDQCTTNKQCIDLYAK